MHQISLCVNFRQQSISNEVTKLRGTDGSIKTEWGDLVGIAREHFVNLLGTAPTLSDEALEEVLAQQTKKIPLEDRNALEAPISLEEMHVATLAMARNKVSSKDGIPIEFYLAVWEEVGPILLSDCVVGGAG